MPSVQELVSRSLVLLARPLARFCIRHAMQFQVAEEALRRAFVAVAKEEVAQSGSVPNVSRISVTTGINRRDVGRLMGHLESDPEQIEAETGIIVRVIGTWRGAARYLTESRKPRTLSVDGKQSEFFDLVRSVSKDANPYAVLAELWRLNLIDRTERGVRLRSQAYVPAGDVRRGLGLLSTDLDDLISAVDENVFRPRPVPNLHIRTEYDNVPAVVGDKLRELLLQRGTEFHAALRDLLAPYDRDIAATASTPETTGGEAETPGDRIRIAIGTFSIVEPYSPAQPADSAGPDSEADG